MRKVLLFIAQSLDGKIARVNHDLKWLTEFPNPNNLDFGYNHLISRVDTLVMGRNTYEDLKAMDMDWPYNSQKTFVFSSQKDLTIFSKNTEMVNKNLSDWVKSEVNKEGKDIWIVGGASLIAEFINERLIDEITITTVPVIIGDGIPLFKNIIADVNLELKSVETFENGMINTVYVCPKR